MIYAVACASGWYRYAAEGEVKLVAIPDYSSHPWTLFSTFHLKLFSAILKLNVSLWAWTLVQWSAQQQDWIPNSPGGGGVPALHVAPFHPTYSSHSAATQ